jgi:hypothetical protein
MATGTRSQLLLSQKSQETHVEQDKDKGVAGKSGTEPVVDADGSCLGPGGYRFRSLRALRFREFMDDGAGYVMGVDHKQKVDKLMENKLIADQDLEAVAARYDLRPKQVTNFLTVLHFQCKFQPVSQFK